MRALALAALIVVVPRRGSTRATEGGELRWSPYYAVDHKIATGAITVNTIGHQQMVPFDKGGASYSLIHLLQKHGGGEPFHDVLVIGAGSGNDLTHALRFGARRVDAVEIDPTIQDIGSATIPTTPTRTRESFATSTTGGISCARPSARTIWSSTPSWTR